MLSVFVFPDMQTVLIQQLVLCVQPQLQSIIAILLVPNAVNTCTARHDNVWICELTQAATATKSISGIVYRHLLA